MDKKTVPALIGMLVLTYMLHFSALTLKLYWSTMWFDKVVHLCGGIAIGYFFFTFRKYLGVVEEHLGLFVSVVLTVVLIGIAWECFEFSAGIAVQGPGFWFDTATDLLADILGGVIVYVRMTRHYEINA